MLRWLAWILIVPILASASDASADTWAHTDKSGVMHFTNIKPRPERGKRWRRIQKDSPSVGKAVGRRGNCEGCDRVPAGDSSPDRFNRYDEFILQASRAYEIPVALIRAVIKTESDYDPRVVSIYGARGLMQLMPSVIKDMGVEDVHDPRQNILGGTRLLRVLANRYEGDLVKTIAAYHAGVGSLRKYGGTVPPYSRTRTYLKTVLDRYHKYRKAEQEAVAE